MRVMHVITRMIVGGAQEAALSCAVGLSALPGYDVTLVTGPETGPEGDLLEIAKPDLRVISVPSMRRAIHPGADLRSLGALRRLMEHEGPDVVHTHSAKAGIVGRLAARLTGVPAIVHTNHGLAFHKYQSEWANITYRNIERTTVFTTDHYVSVAAETMERLIAAGIGRRSRHSVVRAGFDTDRFLADLAPKMTARAQLDLPADRVVIGVVARLFPLKGHDDLLSIAELLVPRTPEVLFAFVGGGPLLPELQARVRDSGLSDHVRFLGLLPGEMMPATFSSFDILAHASHREGLARVYPQAVLAGVPVVGYDLDGSSEVVDDGSNGYLIPPGDLDTFADRLEKLVRDDRLRESLGGVGRDEIAREFSEQEMVRRLDVLYRRLLGQDAWDVPAPAGG
jgi:glycosyltransferase involved in cell wall biosynthesis